MLTIQNRTQLPDMQDLFITMRDYDEDDEDEPNEEQPPTERSPS